MKQVKRIDVLMNMLYGHTTAPKKLYNAILTDNLTTTDSTRKGFLFETLSIILLTSKCLDIEYTNILDGQLQSLKECKNITSLLKINIVHGSNPSDMTIKQGDDIVPISIKYKNKFLPNQSGVSEIDGEMVNAEISKYKIGLIVRDKSLVKTHNYMNDGGNQKKLHDQVIRNQLLLDEKDIIIGLEKFCNNFRDYKVDDFIEMINLNYLSSGRKRLKLKLHQKMTFMKFIANINQKLHLISHKPRSGKSITILNMCRYLLENGMNRILIMTSVPATIKSFTDDLDKYIEFKDIKYLGQDEFKYLENDFRGIVFCSVQYLKTGTKEKKTQLKLFKSDVMIIDECHMGSSTKNTEANILNVDVEDIRNNIRLNIFASGTSDKTKKFYKIKNVYCWDIEDEGYMKRLTSDEISDDERTEIMDIMRRQHGDEFIRCMDDPTLNKDYSKHPTQILMKHLIPDNIITEIKQYNERNNTNYGYSCSSLFALDKVKDRKTLKYKYDNRFELECSADGTELLKSFFECIISDNRMNRTTIMKKIEKMQSDYHSRISQKGAPKLFLMYLPTHTGNNRIAELQKTFKQFIEKHNLWTEYLVEYSNSIEDSGDCKEEYMTYITTILDKTIKNNKKGCILLLGNKGGVGITYHNCDVTISLDDGHNLDNQRQRYSRALTEGIDKTIGINVDMNIQRTYLYLNDVIHKHRTITRTTRTNGEILMYLYTHNIFLFNPQDIDNGRVKTFEITEYFNKEAGNILKIIDDAELLNQIIVADNDVNLDDEDIGIKFTWDDITTQPEVRIVNPELEGEQQDCPKGDITRNYVGDDKGTDEAKDDDEQLTEDMIERKKRFFKELCRRVLFPLLALLSRTFQSLEFKEMLFHANTKEIVNGILKDKKIILNKNSYNSIIRIMENNDEIINNIREIYRTAPSNKIHQLIAKHFIPSIEEKKNNAEIPTPLELVIEMLGRVPEEFWKTPKRVFEPCCGKGNFVMKIFEKFYDGLAELYLDEKERCAVIIGRCMYFADLTPMNVFITTEILKCEIQRRTDIVEMEYKFNSYTGDTLELDVKKTFNINKFDAVIGNPPYNDSSGNKGKGHMLWDKFVKISLNKFVKEKGYLVYVHPAVWRQYEHSCLDIIKNKQVIYLEIHNVEDGQKTFRCATRYDWYVLQNTKNTINTIIKGEDGVISEIDLKEWEFIPNMMFDEIKNLISNDDKLDVNYYRSNYGADKKWVKKNKNDEFKYPVVYSINKENKLSLCYSNTNENGHFGKSKFIFSNGAGFYCDCSGDYGLTQWSYCIYDAEENLPLIEKAFRSIKFNKIKEAIHLDSSSYNIKVMKLFKKDFYNEFTDDFIDDFTDDFIGDPSENITNENKPEIIKKGRANYYLVENRLYRINKDKTQGDYYCEYVAKKNIDNKSKQKKVIKENLIKNNSKAKMKLRKAVANDGDEDEPVGSKIVKKSKASSNNNTDQHITPKQKTIVSKKNDGIGKDICGGVDDTMVSKKKILKPKSNGKKVINKIKVKKNTNIDESADTTIDDDPIVKKPAKRLMKCVKREALEGR